MTTGLLNQAKLLAAAALFAVAALACATTQNSGGTDQSASSESNSQSQTSTSPASSSGSGGEVSDGGDNAGANAVTTDPATGAGEPAAVQDPVGALFLEIDAPAQPEMFVSSSRLDITGRTTVDALVSVNDTIVEIDEEGRFALSFGLEEGPNLIEIVASNAEGEQFDDVLLVIYEPA